MNIIIALMGGVLAFLLVLAFTGELVLGAAAGVIATSICLWLFDDIGP